MSRVSRQGLPIAIRLAFAYRQYLGGCEAKEYLDAEYRTSRHRYGVWQVPGGISRPWDFRRGRRNAVIPDGTTPGGHRYRCKEIGSYARAQELLRQGHTDLDSNGDGEACESLRCQPSATASQVKQKGATFQPSCRSAVCWRCS